jgi:DNA-binding NarL/FixJ family response regulator
MTVLSNKMAPEAESRGWALVIDDHPLFCEALELTLSSIDPGLAIRTAESLAGGLAEIEAGERPALVFLDLNLPDVSGFDGLLRLRRAAEGVPVLVVSSLTEPRIVEGALEAGAVGYVPKHSPRAVFEAALAAIAQGGTFLPAGMERSVAPGGPSAINRLATLTPQQDRILELICDGLLNKQIAHELSIAETTVKAHVTAIMRKLGVRSRTQAVLVAQQAQFGPSA